jgi:hypothetical protein
MADRRKPLRRGIRNRDYCGCESAMLHSQGSGSVCERSLLRTDHAVLVGGTIFIVEIKNYNGRLVWEDAGERGLVHWKTGNYGETTLPKPAKNPLTQARSYIRSAKAYFSATCDRRFANVHMEPVGAFTRTAPSFSWLPRPPLAGHQWSKSTVMRGKLTVFSGRIERIQQSWKRIWNDESSLCEEVAEGNS